MRPDATRMGRAALLAGSLLALAAAGPASAHPHVMVTVRTIVMLDSGGAVTELRHAWTFDEAFSAYATTGLDKNKDGKLDRAELSDLAKVNVESLNEYGYFTFVRRGKAKSGFGDVKDYWLEHDGKALILHFTLPVSANPLAAKDALLEVYDPSYFVAFDFAKDDPVKVEGGPAPCTASIKAPPASVTQRLSQLGEGFFQSLDPSGGAEWANSVRFACK